MFEEAEGLLDELGLAVAKEMLPAKVESAMAKELSYAEFLKEVLEAECSTRRHRSYETRLRLAGLPHRKGLATFDFNFAKGVDKTTISDLASLAFIHSATNAVFLGPPGVGKTHLSVALAMEALAGGHSVYFTTMAKMIRELLAIPTRYRARKYLAPKLLVIDEIGYKNLDAKAAAVFFDVISARYETASVICSSNKGFGDWGELMGDNVLATAILDRLLHHCVVVNIKGDSYRLKDRAKQGTSAHLDVALAKAKGEAIEESQPF